MVGAEGTVALQDQPQQERWTQILENLAASIDDVLATEHQFELRPDNSHQLYQILNSAFGGARRGFVFTRDDQTGIWTPSPKNEVHFDGVREGASGVTVRYARTVPCTEIDIKRDIYSPVYATLFAVIAPRKLGPNVAHAVYLSKGVTDSNPFESTWRRETVYMD